MCHHNPCQITYHIHRFVHKHIYVSDHCFISPILCVPDVWLPQAQDVPEPRRLLYLSGQVFQLPLHRQQALWEGLSQLLWVSGPLLYTLAQTLGRSSSSLQLNSGGREVWGLKTVRFGQYRNCNCFRIFLSVHSHDYATPLPPRTQVTVMQLDFHSVLETVLF